MSHVPVRLAELRRACAGRTLAQLCLPRALAEEDLQQIDGSVPSWLLEKNEILCHADARLSAFYLVRSGSLQAHLDGPTGVRRVLGFYLPGEAAGLDALQNGQHKTECVALEASTVCTIPSYRLEELCALMPGLRHQMIRFMSKAVCSEHRPLLSLRRLDEEQRLASFLLNLQQRQRTDWPG